MNNNHHEQHPTDSFTATADTMIAIMPRKKPRPSGTDKSGGEEAKSPSTTIGVRVSQAIKDVLQKIADENRRHISTEVLIAIEDRLKAMGRFPHDDE